MRVTEATNTWVYATATIRQVNGSTANQLDFVRGLDEDPVKVFAKSLFLADTIGEQGRIMMGLDSTTVMATGCLPGVVQCDVALQIEELNASWHGLPGLGRHYLAWLEYGTAGHVITWSGDAGVPTLNQAGIHGEVWA
jgi:hypothetical protein